MINNFIYKQTFFRLRYSERLIQCQNIKAILNMANDTTVLGLKNEPFIYRFITFTPISE